MEGGDAGREKATSLLHKAIAVCTHLLEHRPVDSLGLLLLSEAQFNLGRNDQALKTVGSAISGLQWARNKCIQAGPAEGVDPSLLGIVGLWCESQVCPLLALGYSRQGAVLVATKQPTAAVVAFDTAERLADLYV